MNRTKLFFVMIVLTLAGSLKAQEHLAVGLKMGYTSTQYTTSSISSANWPDFSQLRNDVKGGYLIGAYGRVKLIGNLSLQPEMYFAKKSGQVKYEIVSGDYATQDISIHTWDIPILAHFTFVDLKVARLYGLTGPVVSFTTKNATEVVDQIDSKDKVNKANWGYQLGAGLQVWKFNFDCRYEWGLSNVSDGLSGVKFNRKSNMLTFSLGYRLFGI